jgi:uroporphyrinogen-III synthase
VLAPAGIVLERRVVYRTDAVARLPPALATALQDRTPAAVLHFSRRSAQTYVDLVAAADLTTAALRPRQLCLSAQVAAPLMQAGAAAVEVAEVPSEAALLALLGRQGAREPLNSRAR